MNCDAAIILLKINTCREHMDDVWENRLYYQVRHEKKLAAMGDLDLLGMCDRRLCAVSEKNHVPPGYRRRTLYFIFIYLIFAQKKDGCSRA
ncbi:hypothetical protein GCM10027361_30590 [Erwinia aphidicola]